jgi:hypothetical protein
LVQVISDNDFPCVNDPLTRGALRPSALNFRSPACPNLPAGKVAFPEEIPGPENPSVHELKHSRRVHIESDRSLRRKKEAILFNTLFPKLRKPPGFKQWSLFAAIEGQLCGVHFLHNCKRFCIGSTCKFRSV